jgi:hypothetical protein
MSLFSRSRFHDHKVLSTVVQWKCQKRVAALGLTDSVQPFGMRAWSGGVGAHPLFKLCSTDETFLGKTWLLAGWLVTG